MSIDVDDDPTESLRPHWDCAFEFIQQGKRAQGCPHTVCKHMARPRAVVSHLACRLLRRPLLHSRKCTLLLVFTVVQVLSSSVSLQRCVTRTIRGVQVSALTAARNVHCHSICHTDPSTGVLVHCVSGISRSGATVVAYVMATRNCSVDDALATVRAKRPVVSPNSGFKAQLHAFEAERRTGH